MDGGSTVPDWNFQGNHRTIVLVGRTGNGKSATGNSILLEKKFKSMSSSAGVTSVCQLQSTVTEDGHILNVIDTPGFFDFSAESESIGEEIVKCIGMSKDGIHAVLLVLSVRSRFSREEEVVVQSMKSLFGDKITDYMIIVFTGGDELEDNDETLDDYFGRYCPEPLKDVLEMCGHRRILFDNKTKDGSKKSEQLKKLLVLVDVIVGKNSGKPYTNELFAELKVVKRAKELRDQAVAINTLEGHTLAETSLLMEQLQGSHDDELKRMVDMVESKLRETMHVLEKQLEDEKKARLEAEASARAAQKKSRDEMRKVRENIERAQREAEAIRRAPPPPNFCTIL